MDINYYKQYEPIFGSWHITRQIGEGSFGKVFEIQREDFGTTYRAALKAITVPASEAELLCAGPGKGICPHEQAQGQQQHRQLREPSGD